jgi:hypothetical protein
MTLGTGIFLSSLFLGLILLFWITKDRWKWSRIFAWLVGGIVVIGAGAYLYFNYEEPPTKQLGYADLKLGMSENEVRYIKGSPTEVMEADALSPGFDRVVKVDKLDQGRTVSDYPEWSYTDTSSRIDITFDPNRKVKAIQCYATSYGCPYLFGLHVGSSEDQVLARLGKPTSQAVQVNGSTKRMVYGPYNVVFFLTKKEVYMLLVTADLAH